MDIIEAKARVKRLRASLDSSKLRNACFYPRSDGRVYWSSKPGGTQRSVPLKDRETCNQIGMLERSMKAGMGHMKGRGDAMSISLPAKTSEILGS